MRADLCKAFTDSYWRERDCERADPDAFVKGADEARATLAALIPDASGVRMASARKRRFILEEVNEAAATREACNARCTRWARCGGHGAGAASAIPAADRDR